MDLGEGRSQFYIEGLTTGTVTVTATLVVGYDRRIITVTTDPITVNPKSS